MSAKTFCAMALATTCLWPLASRADDDFGLDDTPPQVPASKPVMVNEAGVAVGGVGGAKGRFNRYRGGATDGAAGTAWFNTESRATGKDEGTAYFKAEAEDIDLGNNRLAPDGSMLLRFGEQGSWDARIAYDGIAFQQSDNFHTVFGSGGELLNGLRPGSIAMPATTNAAVVAAATAAGVPKLKAAMSTAEVGTRRDRMSGQFNYAGIPDWTLTGKMEHEHKQGTKINSLLFYNSSYFLAIPEPVDYDTDRFTAAASYTTRPLQAKVSYVMSSFTNNQTSFRTQTPFDYTPITGYQYSELSLPPSNQEHRLKAQFGINPSDTTHIAVNLSSALQIQNDSFTGRLYERTPRISDNSYDGLIRTNYGNVALTSRPLKDWNFRAAYTLDQHANKSAQYYQEPSYRADGTAAWNGGTSSGAGTLGRGVHYNQPYSWLNQRADLEAGYRLLKSTKLTLDYSYKDNQREYSVTSRNQESTVGGRVQTTLAPGLTGMLGYARGIRQATQYDGNAGWAQLGRNLTGGSSERDSRMYAYAARERDELKANVNWGAAPELSLGLTGRYVKDEFPGTFFGVTDNHIASVGPDVTIVPLPTVTMHLYYTYQENYTALRSTTSATGNHAEWRLKNRNTVHSAGIRNDWQVNDRLKLSLDNNISYGNTAFEEASWWMGSTSTGSAYTAASLPDNRSITNILKLSGEYELSDGLSVGLMGMWERFISKDYLNWQEAASTSNQTQMASIGAEGNPGYSAAMVMATAKLRW